MRAAEQAHQPGDDEGHRADPAQDHHVARPVGRSQRDTERFGQPRPSARRRGGVEIHAGAAQLVLGIEPVQAVGGDQAVLPGEVGFLPGADDRQPHHAEHLGPDTPVSSMSSPTPTPRSSATCDRTSAPHRSAATAGDHLGTTAPRNGS